MRLATILNSAGAAIEAALDILEADMEKPPPAPTGQVSQETCTHPLEARINYSTPGWERWQCKLCGYVYERRLKKEGEAE